MGDGGGGGGGGWEPGSTRQGRYFDVSNNIRSVIEAIFDFHLQAYE